MSSGIFREYRPSGNISKLETKQNNELDKIKARLSNLPDNIEELQKWFKLNGQDISVVKCTKRFINLQK